MWLHKQQIISTLFGNVISSLFMESILSYLTLSKVVNLTGSQFPLPVNEDYERTYLIGLLGILNEIICVKKIIPQKYSMDISP